MNQIITALNQCFLLLGSFTHILRIRLILTS